MFKLPVRILSRQLTVWAVSFLAAFTSGSPVVLTRQIPSNSSACTKSLPPGVSPGQTTNISIESNGIPRSFLVNIPTQYSSQALSPVILSFHGGQRDAFHQLELDLLSSPDFNTLGAVLVYPQGIDEIWQGIPGSTANDTAFVSDILGKISRDYCVDTARIYATGKSDGGGFCNTLACDAVLSQQIAAFAPVSGAFYQPTLPCQPTNTNFQCFPGRAKIPFLEFHGGNDTTISYTGGLRKAACLPALPHLIQDWAVRNGLDTTYTAALTALDTLIYTYGAGVDTGLVTHVLDTNIGHDWPSTLPNSDNAAPGHHVASFNASTAIVQFFARYHLPATPPPPVGEPLSIQGETLGIFEGPIN